MGKWGRRRGLLALLDGLEDVDEAVAVVIVWGGVMLVTCAEIDAEGDELGGGGVLEEALDELGLANEMGAGLEEEDGSTGDLGGGHGGAGHVRGVGED